LNHVELTITPGDILSVQRVIDYRDAIGTDALVPIIKMSSDYDASQTLHYSQLAPTAAEAKVKFKYDLSIQRPEWHQLYSPLQTTMGDITFTSDGASSAMSLVYGGNNVYKWDEQSTTTLWKPSLSTDSFNVEPHIIYFQPNQVPCIMTVEGFLSVKNPEVVVTESAYPTNSSGNVVLGYNSPYWSSYQLNDNNKGWNFYGNPYLSWIGTGEMVSNYSSNMNGMNLNIFMYEPYGGNQINSENNYKNHNGNTGDTEASHINPFQAFFMRYTGSSPGQSGASHGKKARKNNIVSGGMSMKQTNYEAIGLSLFEQGESGSRIYLDPRETMTSLAADPINDGTRFSAYQKIFAILFDSAFYSIKVVPTLEEGLTVKVASISPDHGQQMQIANNEYFPNDHSSYLYDRATGVTWNLCLGPYNYVNDTTFNDYRFDWFVGQSVLGLPEDFGDALSFSWYYSEEDIILSVSDADYEAQIQITDIAGRILYKSNHKERVDGFKVPSLNSMGYCTIQIGNKYSMLIPSFKNN